MFLKKSKVISANISNLLKFNEVKKINLKIIFSICYCFVFACMISFLLIYDFLKNLIFFHVSSNLLSSFDYFVYHTSFMTVQTNSLTAIFFWIYFFVFLFRLISGKLYLISNEFAIFLIIFQFVIFYINWMWLGCTYIYTGNNFYWWFKDLVYHGIMMLSVIVWYFFIFRNKNDKINYSSKKNIFKKSKGLFCINGYFILWNLVILFIGRIKFDVFNTTNKYYSSINYRVPYPFMEVNMQSYSNLPTAIPFLIFFIVTLAMINSFYFTIKYISDFISKD